MSGEPIDNNEGDKSKGGTTTNKSTNAHASASAPTVAPSASSTTGRRTTSGSGAPSGGDDDPRRGKDDNGPGDGNGPPPGPGPGPRHISRSPSVVMIPARLPNVQDRPSVMKTRGGGYPQQPPLPDGSPNILDTWERSVLNVNAQSRSSVTEPLHAQFMELVTEVFDILMMHNHAPYTSNIHQYVETIATSVNGMPDIPVRPGQAQYNPGEGDTNTDHWRNMMTLEAHTHHILQAIHLLCSSIPGSEGMYVAHEHDAIKSLPWILLCMVLPRLTFAQQTYTMYGRNRIYTRLRLVFPLDNVSTIADLRQILTDQLNENVQDPVTLKRLGDHASQVYLQLRAYVLDQEAVLFQENVLKEFCTDRDCPDVCPPETQTYDWTTQLYLPYINSRLRPKVELLVGATPAAIVEPMMYLPVPDLGRALDHIYWANYGIYEFFMDTFNGEEYRRERFVHTHTTPGFTVPLECVVMPMHQYEALRRCMTTTFIQALNDSGLDGPSPALMVKVPIITSGDYRNHWAILKRSHKSVPWTDQTIYKEFRVSKDPMTAAAAFSSPPGQTSEPFYYTRDPDEYTYRTPLGTGYIDVKYTLVSMTYAHYRLITIGTELHPSVIASDINHGCLRVSDRTTSSIRPLPVLTWDKFRQRDAPARQCAIDQWRIRHPDDIDAANAKAANEQRMAKVEEEARSEAQLARILSAMYNRTGLPPASHAPAALSASTSAPELTPLAPTAPVALASSPAVGGTWSQCPYSHEELSEFRQALKWLDRSPRRAQICQDLNLTEERLDQLWNRDGALYHYDEVKGNWRIEKSANDQLTKLLRCMNRDASGDEPLTKLPRHGKDEDPDDSGDNGRGPGSGGRSLQSRAQPQRSLSAFAWGVPPEGYGYYGTQRSTTVDPPKETCIDLTVVATESPRDSTPRSKTVHFSAEEVQTVTRNLDTDLSNAVNNKSASAYSETDSRFDPKYRSDTAISRNTSNDSNVQVSSNTPLRSQPVPTITPDRLLGKSARLTSGLKRAVHAGDRRLELYTVADEAACRVGDLILIDATTEAQEVGVMADYGSIILKDRLQHDHPEDAVIFVYDFQAIGIPEDPSTTVSNGSNVNAPTGGSNVNAPTGAAPYYQSPPPQHRLQDPQYARMVPSPLSADMPLKILQHDPDAFSILSAASQSVKLTSVPLGIIAKADNRANDTFPVVMDYNPVDKYSAIKNEREVDMPLFSGEDVLYSQFLPLRARKAELLGRSLIQFNEEMRDGKHIKRDSRAAKKFAQIPKRLLNAPKEGRGYAAQREYLHHLQRIMGQYLEEIFDNDDVRTRLYQVRLEGGRKGIPSMVADIMTIFNEYPHYVQTTVLTHQAIAHAFKVYDKRTSRLNTKDGLLLAYIRECTQVTRDIMRATPGEGLLYGLKRDITTEDTAIVAINMACERMHQEDKQFRTLAKLDAAEQGDDVEDLADDDDDIVFLKNSKDQGRDRSKKPSLKELTKQRYPMLDRAFKKLKPIPLASATLLTPKEYTLYVSTYRSITTGRFPSDRSEAYNEWQRFKEHANRQEAQVLRDIEEDPENNSPLLSKGDDTPYDDEDAASTLSNDQLDQVHAKIDKLTSMMSSNLHVGYHPEREELDERDLYFQDLLMEPVYAANQGYGYSRGGQSDPSAPYRNLNERPQYCIGCGLPKNRRLDRGPIAGIPIHPMDNCPYAILKTDGWRMNFERIATLETEQANALLDISARYGAIKGVKGDDMEKLRVYVKEIKDGKASA